MRFSITGGRDVTGSAERAPLRPALINLLAVGVITVANSPDGANENRDAVTGVVFAAGKADKPYCAASHLSGGPALSNSSATSSRLTDSVAPTSSPASRTYSPWTVRRSSNSLRSTYP